MFRFPTYINNGKGRDTYISSNNGGFSTYYQPMISKKPQYITSRYTFHKDFSVQKPINRYFSDGFGRDYYIYKDIQEQHSHHDGITSLPSILRNNKPSNYVRLRNNYLPSKFERTLLGRIFYGKCEGVKERQLSPKVKFAKKKKYDSEEKEENEEEKDKESNYKENRVLTEANDIRNIKRSILGKSMDSFRNERYWDNRDKLNSSVQKSSVLRIINPKYRRLHNLDEDKEEEEKDICNKAHQIFGYRSKYLQTNFGVFKQM